MIHEIPLERANLHGHFSRELRAGADDRSRRLGANRRPERGLARAAATGRWSRSEELKSLGHALAGPIEVRGARAGQTLAVRVDERRSGVRGA